MRRSGQKETGWGTARPPVSGVPEEEQEDAPAVWTAGSEEVTSWVAGGLVDHDERLHFIVSATQRLADLGSLQAA